MSLPTSMARVLAAWAVSRACLFVLFALSTTEREVSGDYMHYLRGLAQLDHGGTWSHTLPEYPLPVVALLRVAYTAGDGSQVQFNAALVVALLTADAVFTWTLARHEQRNERLLHGTVAWIVVGFLTGPLLYFRFDIAASMLAAGGLLAAARRPARSGVALAGGFIVKLWPAAFVPVLALGTRRPWRLLCAAATTATAVLVVCIVSAGWDRTVSPLTWQADRGVQIESLVATPLMLARLTAPNNHPVVMAFGAYEVRGPGAHAVSTISTLATTAAALTVLHLMTRCLRLPRRRRAAASSAVALAVTALLVVTDKTFSPQYLLWIAAPLCALVCAFGLTPTAKRLLGVLVLAQILTHAVFPWAYDSLISAHPTALATGVLIARNIVVVVLTALTLREAYSACRDSPQAPHAPSRHLAPRP